MDDNAHLIAWLERLLADGGGHAVHCHSGATGRDIAGRQRLDLALIDLLASDRDGLWLAFELLRLWPRLQVVLMAGPEFSPDEAALCDHQDFPVLRKPFLAQDVLSIIRARRLHPRRSAVPCGPGHAPMTFCRSFTWPPPRTCHGGAVLTSVVPRPNI